jgi:hypothetical protein
LKRWRTLFIGVFAVLATLAVALPVLAHDNAAPDARTAALFRDGDVPCTGADNTERLGGRVSALAQPEPGGATQGTVYFNLHLRNAAPNTDYLLNVSEEPDCNPIYVVNRLVRTDANGRADVYGSFLANEGPHNFLFNLVTRSITDPANPNREIATRNFRLTVPVD